MEEERRAFEKARWEKAAEIMGGRTTASSQWAGDFLTASHQRLIEKIIQMVEEKYGKEGTMTGSLGYQGIMSGIHAFNSAEDTIRDTIINLLKES